MAIGSPNACERNESHLRAAIRAVIVEEVAARVASTLAYSPGTRLERFAQRLCTPALHLKMKQNFKFENKRKFS